ncbi:hypothetical protein DH2020_019592 [Rehmannia glutinosa]|uniref:F-box protein n=1 Tax=Rehmannia glutinosa TaxID=99300 RepID=A0ABR0WRK0_REHGL
MLHHILSFLSQKEAIQTCVLSKSWRYLGSTRPNFECCERWFNADKQTFVSAMDKILHRYHDQKLSIQEFILEMSMGDSESISFFEKWIPLVMLNMGVNTFSFKDVSYFWARFALPSLVYKVEFVKELNLNRCKLSQINPLDKTFEKIMSSCPLIEDVNLHGCEGLKTIKVNKAHNLKYFYFFNNLMPKNEDDRSIEIDAITLESISILCCWNWFRHGKYFPYLKCLHLDEVRLSTKSFDSFSCNYPCLEKLSLIYCHGFEEIQLLSHSIKFLAISVDMPIRLLLMPHTYSTLNSEAIFCHQSLLKQLPVSGSQIYACRILWIPIMMLRHGS